MAKFVSFWLKALICVDRSRITNEGFKWAVKALRTDIENTLLYVFEEHGIYESYKRIFREDLERMEVLFDDVGSEKEAAKKMLWEITSVRRSVCHR